MEDLNQVQNDLNQEFAQKKREELRTPAGAKKAIVEAFGKFLNKLMMKRNYQVVAGIILAYIVGAGLWFMFNHLISGYTAVVVALCLLLVYMPQIKKAWYAFCCEWRLFVLLRKKDMSYLSLWIKLNWASFKSGFYEFFGR